MRRVKTVGIYLTGGLGNQLFQLAAALSLAQGTQIYTFEKPGRPRLNLNGDPELFNLSIDQITSIRRGEKDGLLLRKSLGFNLRSSASPRKNERIFLTRFLANLVTTSIQSIYLRKFFYSILSQEIGYHQMRTRKTIDRLFDPALVGYFQSYVWPESVRSKLQSLRLVKEGPDLKSLRIEANVISPVVVHIRRGDYETQATFGLLGENYYRKAIEKIDFFYADNPIWVFSDEVSEAKKILAWLPQERLKYISDVDGQSAASLMAMRLGCAYVIANSTFSWWGAFLSEKEAPLVVAPDPWFTGQSEPSMMIPTHWLRIKH